MNEVDWTLAPKGATHHNVGGCYKWYKLENNKLSYWDYSSASWGTSANSVEWLERGCIHRPSVVIYESATKKHPHYYKDVSHLDTIDVYRVLDLFNVTKPCVQHAAKKLLCSGSRGVKDYKQDIQEAIDSLNRELEMLEENENANN